MTDLDGILREIEAAIGTDKAMLIAHAFAGQEVWPSRDPGPDNKLVPIIGREAVQELARVFGTDKLLIPMAANRRNVLGVRLAREGATRDEIARKLRVHTRTADRYIAAAGGRGRDDGQGEFDLGD